MRQLCMRRLPARLIASPLPWVDSATSPETAMPTTPSMAMAAMAPASPLQSMLEAVAGLAARAGVPVASPQQAAAAVCDSVARLNASAYLASFDAVCAPGPPGGGTIAAAIAGCAEGARIFLRPGRYNEMLGIAKDVHVFGNRAAVIKWTVRA